MNHTTPNHGVSLIPAIKGTLLMPVLLVIAMISCTKSGTKNDPPVISPPTLTTTATTIVTQYTAQSGGNVSSNGASVTARGICWSLNPSPTTADSKTSDGTGTGSYSSIMTGLNPGTKYYIRSYGTNSTGTAYGNEISFTTQLIDTNSVTDIDGNVYPVVRIGNQVWMKENLKVTRYRNGDPISTGLNNTAWSSATSGAYAYYNNDAGNNTVFGKLYNWYAAADPRNIAPPGWHVPSRDERAILISSTIRGWDSAGGDMKEAGLGHWTAPNSWATNSSGFSGLPGGGRWETGIYLYIGSAGYWWCNTDDGAGSTDGDGMSLSTNDADAIQYGGSKIVGSSIRCIRD